MIGDRRYPVETSDRGDTRERPVPCQEPGCRSTTWNWSGSCVPCLANAGRTVCVGCGVARPARQVRPDPSPEDGHHGICTTCQPSTRSLGSLMRIR